MGSSRTRQGHESAWNSLEASDFPTLAGRVLGSYRLVARLGEGGMGVVYLGEHIKLNKMVAIKVVRRELTSHPEILHRFFNEAKAVNAIGHPNIVSIVDFVEKFDEDPPIVYMVLEYLSGETLAKHIEENGAMSPEETVRIGLQMTDALGAIHQAKVLHRDLKPENIFLCETEDESPPPVKLLDFGVAKKISDVSDDDITEPGMTVGTPEFMAPEQILDRKLDERMDIYLLGMVLYNMLTGDVPFKAEGLGKLLKQHLREPPLPIGMVRSGGKRVPPALDFLVMKCMEKDPAMRYQTASELNDALAHCLPGTEKGEAGKASSGSGRWIMVGLALTVIVLAVAVVLLLTIN